MPLKYDKKEVRHLKSAFREKPFVTAGAAGMSVMAKTHLGGKMMRNGNRINRMLAVLMAASMMTACTVPACAEDAAPYDGGLRIEDGTLLPICECSDPRDPGYSNENSDILRFCVYVETDNDTDNDGMADLVKALVQVPRAAVLGKYKAATIYDPYPYAAGTCDDAYINPDHMFNIIPFDYDSLYRACKKM